MIDVLILGLLLGAAVCYVTLVAVWVIDDLTVEIREGRDDEPGS